MKNTILTILALLIALSFSGCDNGNNPSHTHEWEWKVTTPATTATDGVETETCKICGAINGTRPIAKLPQPVPTCNCPNGADHWEGDDCCLNNDGAKTTDCDCKTVNKASGVHVQNTPYYEGEDGDCYAMFNGQLTRRPGDNCVPMGPRPLPCPCPEGTVHDWGTNCPEACVGVGHEGCDCTIGEEPAVVQTPVPINLSFSGDFTATVKGTLTNTQWVGVPVRIANAINGAYGGTFMDQMILESVFEYNNVEIIAEKTTEYDIYKVVANNKTTLYVNIDGLDSLQSKIVAAATAMVTGDASMAKAPVRSRANDYLAIANAAVQRAFQNIRHA